MRSPVSLSMSWSSAVSMMTGVSPRWRISASTFQPSTCGICTSSSTRSGFSDRWSSSARRPSAACTVRRPLRAKYAIRISAISGSSSAMRTSACAPWPAPGDEGNSGMATRSDSAGFHRIAILPYGPRNRTETGRLHRPPSSTRSLRDLSEALQCAMRQGNTLSFFSNPVLCIMTYLLQRVLIQGAGKSLSVQGSTARVQAGMRTGFARPREGRVRRNEIASRRRIPRERGPHAIGACRRSRPLQASFTDHVQEVIHQRVGRPAAQAVAQGRGGVGRGGRSRTRRRAGEGRCGACRRS
ncbi:hypothetical protein F01_420096 [Burkholderia cenocepacia]|nr:hypothetical protein F01_420096 [Burkholderia cenocepacia]